MHVATGVYRIIRPPEKLVFTWSWEDDPKKIDTAVTIDFRDAGSSTEVLLTHEFFPDMAARYSYKKGWSGCLDKLETLFSM